MTFQPPPSGGTPPPSPSPSGQWGPPPGSPGAPGGGYPNPGPGFDPKAVNPLDWGILAAGFLALIFSFFDYYTISYSGSFGSASASASAWHGFFGWFAAIVALLSAGVIAMGLFSPQVKLPFHDRLASLIGFGVATVCVILALPIIPDGNVSNIPGLDDGHGFGYWASLVVIVAGLVLSFMRYQQSGGKLPGGLGGSSRVGHRAPQGGSYAPPPSGGFQSQGPAGPAGPPPGSAPPPPPGSAPPPPPGYGPPR
jgi:hypothetical protein